MKRWWLAVYAPGMLLGCVGVATWWVGYAAGSALWLLPGLVLAIALSWLAERCWPYDPAFNAPQGDAGRDAVHALVNEGLNLLAIGAIPLVAAWVPWQLWPTHWSVVAQVVLAIVAADLGITLVHYASHRWAWLWRLHAVHHSVTRMYGFNGLMKHPLHQTAEALGGVLPLLLLGMPYPVAAVLAFAIAIQLLLQHSNVDMRPGWLGKVMAWAPAASVPPHALWQGRRRQLRIVPDRLGPSAGDGLRCRLPDARGRPGDWQPAGLSTGLPGATAGAVPRAAARAGTAAAPGAGSVAAIMLQVQAGQVPGLHAEHAPQAAREVRQVGEAGGMCAGGQAVSLDHLDQCLAQPAPQNQATQ